MNEGSSVGLQRLATTLLWLGATVISVFLALLVIDSAFFEGEYIPIGNDSFYHARRMLDTAVGDRGFYQPGGARGHQGFRLVRTN